MQVQLVMARNSQFDNRISAYTKARNSGMRKLEAGKAIGLKSPITIDKYEAVWRERMREVKAAGEPEPEILAATLWKAIRDPNTPPNLLAGLAGQLRALKGWGKDIAAERDDRGSIADLIRAWGAETPADAAGGRSPKENAVEVDLTHSATSEQNSAGIAEVSDKSTS